MKSYSRPLRIPSRLPDSIHHQLSMYALAAGATAAGVLALAQPSEAKIVYTKTHKVIGIDETFPLDLNHDGVIDFLIKNYSAYELGVDEAFGNKVEGSGNLAFALRKGATIGPRQHFISSSGRLEVMFDSFCSETCVSSGQWKNVNNRYLGLKFQIKGKTHYGWARLNVSGGYRTVTGTLTGYAYETIPDEGILAGQTAGGSEAAVVQPSGAQRAASDPARPVSLGRLALRAADASWGRKQ
jgi:hypothetical protein